MALNFGGLFRSGFFRPSYEDGEFMIAAGDRWIPEEVYEEPFWIDKFTDNQIDANKWTEAMTGSGSSSVANSIVTISTGDTDESTTRETGTTGRQLDTDGAVTMECRFKMTPTAANEVTWAVELKFDSTNTIRLLHSHSVHSANQAQLITYKAGSGSGTTITIADDTWHILKFEATTSYVKMYVDNLLLYTQTNTAHIPTNQVLVPYFYMWTKEANKDQKMYIDWVKLEI